MSYSIDDGDGNQITAGVSEHEIKRVARDAANRLRAAVYYYDPASGDADEPAESIEVRPTLIRMTDEETATYDDGGDDVREPMMRRLRAMAREMHETSGSTIEILTADGIVADVAQ